MSILPADLQKLWDDSVAADAAAERLSSMLTDGQFFWGPDGGRRWSVALCLDHLAVTNTLYAEAMGGAIAKARSRGWQRRGPLTPGFFGRVFADYLEPPPKLRTGAPSKIKPHPARDRVEIMRAYRDAHDRIRELLRQAETVDANRAAFVNPFVPIARVTVSSAFHIMAAHDRRHLWQAERVVQQVPADV